MNTKLNQEEKVKCYEFILQYESEIKHNYGNYNWDSPVINNYCNRLTINKKTKRGEQKSHYYFWFDTNKKGNINDFAHHFLRHIRNAMAHGNIKKEKKMIKVSDYNTNQKETMKGQLPASHFFEFLNTVVSTKR